MKALLIKKRWIDKILRGTKKWELRGSRTQTRGQIALVESKTGTVVGVCHVVGVEGPLSLAKLQRTTSKHGVPPPSLRRLPYKRTYAWVLRKASRLPVAVPYRHPPGAVIWVRLRPKVTQKILQMTSR